MRPIAQKIRYMMILLWYQVLLCLHLTLCTCFYNTLDLLSTLLLIIVQFSVTQWGQVGVFVLSPCLVISCFIMKILTLLSFQFTCPSSCVTCLPWFLIVSTCSPLPSCVQIVCVSFVLCQSVIRLVRSPQPLITLPQPQFICSWCKPFPCILK